MFARVPDGVAAREQGQGEEQRLTRQTPRRVDPKTLKPGEWVADGAPGASLVRRWVPGAFAPSLDSRRFAVGSNEVFRIRAD